MQVRHLWCRWPESNRYAIAGGGFRVHYVYQFHHTGWYLMQGILYMKVRGFARENFAPSTALLSSLKRKAIYSTIRLPGRTRSLQKSMPVHRRSGPEA